MQTLKNSGAPPFKDCDMLKDYVYPISNLSDLLQQGLAVTSMGISATLDLIRSGCCYGTQRYPCNRCPT